MPADKSYKQWGVEDFERYHSGKMPEADMHALEKAALDDPFLEDALEGYAYTKTPVADIAALQEKLWPGEAEVPTPVVWFRRKAFSQLFKAAAVLIIFGGLGWLIINNTGKNQEELTPAVAVNQQPSTKNDSIAALYQLNDTAPIVARLEDEKIKAIIQEQQKNTAGAPVTIKDYQSNIPFEKDEMARNNSRQAETALITPGLNYKPAAAPVTSNNHPLTDDKKPAAELAKADAYPYNNQQLGNQVRGRVVDNAGKPVPFATVRNNADRNQAVMADANGNFVLNNDNAANNNNAIKIEANAAGYEQANSVLNNNSANNTIVLNQSQHAMSEAVVTNAYNTKRSSRDSNGYADTKTKKERYQWNGKNTRIRLKNAAPLEGWDYFYYVMNDSIANNKILNGQKGRITLQFDADAEGAVKNIVIIKSLNDSADKAATQLLYKSPVVKLKNPSLPGEATFKIGL